MKTFVVDRSTPTSVAACYGENAIDALMRYTATNTDPAGRTPQWVSELNTALNDANCHPGLFDAYVVGLGPGSFSGIRASLAFAQGMALVGNKPVYGISSAAVMAWQFFCAHPECDSLTVAGDARRGTLWTLDLIRTKRKLLLHNKSPLTHTVDDFTCLPMEAAISRIPANNPVLTADYNRLLGHIPNLHKATPTAGHLYLLWKAIKETALTEPLPIYLHPAVMA